MNNLALNENSSLEEVNKFINETSEELLYELNDTNKTLFKPYLRKLDKKAKAKMLKVSDRSFDKCIDELIEIAESIPDAEV